MMKEHWKRVMAELLESTCNYCNRTTAYKKNYIQIKGIYNKYYIIDAFCSNCYKYYLEGFPWSSNLSEMYSVYRLPKSSHYDVVDVEFF